MVMQEGVLGNGVEERREKPGWYTISVLPYERSWLFIT